uniref:Probable zinc-ribbon domain-containing protein n=1 Tax=Rhizophora mucronata TaxID=61149 RepID=A0A2P2JUB2_RHIMU
MFLNEYHENGSIEYKSKDFNDETLGNVKFSDRDQNQSDQNDSPYCKNEQPRITNEVSSSIKLVYLENKESFPSGGGNLVPKSNNESSTSAGAKAEEESNNNSASSFGRTKTWNIIDTKWSSSINDTHSSARKSMPSEVPLAPADLQLKQPVQITSHLPDYVRSAGAFERTEFVNPSSELSDTLIDLSKSPTTRSSRAYYDDGISSCEETDGPLSNQNKYPFKSAHKLASSATSDERHRRENFLANSNYAIQNQLRDYASTTSEKAFDDRKVTGLDHDNLLNYTSLCHQHGNRRLQRNEYPSQLPFHQRDSVSGFGSGGPSNQLHNVFHCKESYNSHEKLVYTQQEKLKLLKMVQELQDQLSKSYSSDEKLNGRTTVSSWKDHQVPPCGNALKEGSFHNFNYYLYPARAMGGNSWPQGSEYTRMPFSAEAAHFWQQLDHSLYCCPQDWQLSAQFPGSGLHCNSGFCRAHSGINFHNFCGSCPSSPQQSADSEFLIYSHGAKSDAQRQRDHKVQKCSREKPYLAKRCIRPMAAGSPFITCPRCLKILLLPTDFLLSNRRCHQLRCGACLEVLKFTLLNRSHLLPYRPTAKAPPPSEVDEYAVSTRRIICSSHSVDCPRVDPVSFSNDYELSFCKNCFKNGETPHAICCNATERNVSYPDKGRRKISNERQSKHKNVVEAYHSASFSSKKVSPDANVTPARESSPLHRLMGYLSPSEVINGCGASISRGDLGDKNFSYHAGEGSRQRI